MNSTEKYLDKFRHKVKANKMKQSYQRDIIVNFFYESKSHIDAETLYANLKEIEPSIGHTTVYRTLKLLCDFNMAKAHTFVIKNTTYFEPIDEDTHHDHIICSKCNKIVEFLDEEIELLQEEIAKKYGFLMTDHTLQIYGICKECQEKE